MVNKNWRTELYWDTRILVSHDHLIPVFFSLASSLTNFVFPSKWNHGWAFAKWWLHEQHVTSPKFNMKREDKSLQKNNKIANHYFQVPPVKFQENRSYKSFSTFKSNGSLSTKFPTHIFKQKILHANLLGKDWNVKQIRRVKLWHMKIQNHDVFHFSKPFTPPKINTLSLKKRMVWRVSFFFSKRQLLNYGSWLFLNPLRYLTQVKKGKCFERKRQSSVGWFLLMVFQSYPFCVWMVRWELSIFNSIP